MNTKTVDIHVSAYRTRSGVTAFSFSSLKDQMEDYHEDPSTVYAMKTIQVTFTEGEGLPK